MEIQFQYVLCTRTYSGRGNIRDQYVQCTVYVVSQATPFNLRTRTREAEKGSGL